MGALLPHITEGVLVVFAGIGLFFTYRAWKQREDELHEKYFERRYELYVLIDEAIRHALQRPDVYENWWNQLQGSRIRAGFLFGKEVRKLVEEVHDLIMEYENSRNAEDEEKRVATARIARSNVEAKADVLRQAMAAKIILSR